VGYVEFAYAKQNKMANVLLINQSHHPIAPSAASFQAAAANADWTHAEGYYLILTDQAGANSWPITGASFILVYSNPPDPVATGEALKFFGWAYQNGTQMASDLDYVPLPAALIKQVQTTWKSAIKANGAPLWK
jgi:phosphate transport system substrate-binding protein